MERYTIVPSRYWLNEKTKTKASIFGSTPWSSASDKVNWTLTTTGYTIRDNRNGTIGMGKQPARTLQEAQIRLQALEALDRR